MPFVNRSGVADDDALAFGMVEDVIAAISLSPDIRVLASGSTRQWVGKPADLREVGRDLGVRYVLEGNTRRAGANLRVTVQLVEAETGAILWSQKFDRPLSQLAELQEDLVTEVAGYLGVAVQNLEIERALQKPGDLTAYESVQRAWYLFGQQRPDDIAAGIIQARRAVAAAPDYGPAHAMLALGLSLQLRLTGDASLMPEIQQRAERAIFLSPRDVNVLSFVSFAFLPTGQPREALRHAQRAIQLNPDNGLAYAALGFAQVQLGLNDEAIASLVDNKRLVPGDFGQPLGAAYRSIAHYQAGRLEKAIEEMELGFALDPRRPLVLWMRAALCALAGRQADASEAVRQLRAQGVTSETFPRRTAGILAKDAQNAGAFHAALRKAWDETSL